MCDTETGVSLHCINVAVKIRWTLRVGHVGDELHTVAHFCSPSLT